MTETEKLFRAAMATITCSSFNCGACCKYYEFDDPDLCPKDDGSYSDMIQFAKNLYEAYKNNWNHENCDFDPEWTEEEFYNLVRGVIENE